MSATNAAADQQQKKYRRSNRTRREARDRKTARDKAAERLGEARVIQTGKESGVEFKTAVSDMR